MSLGGQPVQGTASHATPPSPTPPHPATQVNARAPGATVEAVDAHLGLLRGAVTSLGGTVSVASGVWQGRVPTPPPWLGSGAWGLGGTSLASRDNPAWRRRASQIGPRPT